MAPATGDRPMWFFWFRRLSPCRKVCCNQDEILLSSKHGKLWLSWDRERAVLGFFAGVEDNYNFEIPLLVGQFKSLHFAEITVLCRNLKLMGQGRLQTVEKSLFISYSQLSGCIFPKTFEILGTELLWLHVSVIFFSLTQKFAVSKFYSLGIKIIIHL